MKILYCLFFSLALVFVFKPNGLCVPQEDQAIINAIKESYTFKTYLQEEDIRVDSQDGVVILSGTVQDQYHKLLARDTASNMPGVKDVIDRMKVKDEGAKQYSDAWLSMKVKSTLLLHFNEVPIVKVYVKDAVVTLQGDVASEKEKKLAEGYAKDVEGVKDLVNELRVVEQKPEQGTKIDDASISAQVKFLLLFRFPASAFKVGIKTEEGVVTLTGNVQNTDEKKKIYELVSGIKGVKKVIDNTAIKQPK